MDWRKAEPAPMVIATGLLWALIVLLVVLAERVPFGHILVAVATVGEIATGLVAFVLILRQVNPLRAR